MSVPTARCRAASCRAAIVWATRTDGKRVPLDPTPSERGFVVYEGEGLVRVVADREELARLRASGDRPLYTLHHSTCPDRARFSRRGAKR